MILLWGLESERPLALTYAELEKLGEQVVMIDQRDVATMTIQLALDHGVAGTLCIKDEDLALANVTAIYARPYDVRCLPVVEQAGPGSSTWQHAFAFHETFTAWLEMTPALVVNRFSAMASNGSKPYQLALIRQSGFRVPQTLITTDPEAVRAFWQRHGTIIYKSISGIRSIVSRLESADLDRLANVAWCPTQFQQYISGRDHRVHVIGTEVFAGEVMSDAVDYRYPGAQPVEIRACQLPDEIVTRCRQLAAALQLPVAGIDLRRTPDGEWYCFEVNPSPAFSYYQQETGQPISAALARLLAEGERELSERERV